YPCIEDNPNFAVFKRNQASLMVAKCSRVADDNNSEIGRYGIDFHRSLPSNQQAKMYAKGLPQTLVDRRYTNYFAFSADTREEYLQKRKQYEDFYSYIYGTAPGIVFVAPHCGDVQRQPDEYIPRPKLEIDSWTAGLGALCLDNTTITDNRRIMISLHSNGYLGAAIDVGSFGLSNYSELMKIAGTLNQKYQPRMQQCAEEYYNTFLTRTQGAIRRIWDRFGTLNPATLKDKSKIVSSYLTNILNGLNYYKQNIQNYTEEEFLGALNNVGRCEVPAISVDTIYSGKHIGGLLDLRNHIKSGTISGAIQIECAKVYLKQESELMAQIILDLLKQYCRYC
ncbi:hypothetical protein ACFLWR_06905, partial [Chloroflexota bacterium]